MPSSSALWASIGPAITSPMRVDAGHVGLVVRVDDDALAVVELHAGRLQARGPRCRARGRWRPARRRPRSSSAAPPAAGSMVTCWAAPFLATPVTLLASLKVMPCLARMRCTVLATSASMPGRMRSRNSTTVTSEPSRRQTEPSSRPITPAPTTSRRLGTFGSDSAPVDETIAASSMLTPGSLATSEPVAMTMLLVSSCCLPLGAASRSTLPAPRMRAGAVEGVDLVLLEQEGDAVDVALHALVLEGQHLGEIELAAAPRCPCRRSRARPPRTARRRAAAPWRGCSRR